MNQRPVRVRSRCHNRSPIQVTLDAVGVPGVQVGLGAIVSAVVVLSVGVLLLGHLALAAQRLPLVTGGRHADWSTGTGQVAARPGASRVKWLSAVNCGGQRATPRSKLADSFA